MDFISNKAELLKGMKEWAEKKSKGIDDAIEQAVDTHADKVLQTAQSLVPVNSGNLKNALKKKVAKNGKSAKVIVDVKEAPYGFMVHFGTAKQPAQPFLYQASDQHRDEFKKAIEENIKKGDKD